MNLIKKLFSLKHILIFSVATFIIFTFASIFFFILNLDKTSEIEILVAPKDSIIKLNDTTYKNGTHKIKPGIYKVTITPDLKIFKENQFVNYEKEINIQDKTKFKLYYALEPTQNNANYYLENSADYSIVQGIDDLRAREEQKAYVNSDPIFLITPYKNYNQGFEIYSEKSPEKNLIKINLLTCNPENIPALHSKALDWLSSNSINVDKYIIGISSCDNY